MKRIRPFLSATVALAVASSMALLPALTSATSASAAAGQTQLNAACPAGYGSLVVGGVPAYGLQGQGKGNPVKTINPSNCWTFVPVGSLGGQQTIYLIKNAAGNCLSWWSSIQRFVLADPGCNASSERQQFGVPSTATYEIFDNIWCGCDVSAFTITSGSELGLYIGAPIRNDEWNGIAPAP
jgi:hypothetical protein